MGDGSKARLAIAAVAAFVVVFGGVRLLERARAAPGGGGGAVTVDSAPTPAPAPSAGGEPAPADGTGGPRLYVDVAGEVRRPGLYQVPRGSRVAAAVSLAGGFTRRADATQVNLAAPVQDGQQVIVPRAGAGGAGPVAGSPGGAAAGAAGSGGRQISLSTATVEQLDTLDGIGPTLAQRIVQYRQAHGGFHSLDELRQVDGIGDKRFQQLKKGLQP
jgi:competence protein ComEA